MLGKWGDGVLRSSLRTRSGLKWRIREEREGNKVRGGQDKTVRAERSPATDVHVPVTNRVTSGPGDGRQRVGHYTRPSFSNHMMRL